MWFNISSKMTRGILVRDRSGYEVTLIRPWISWIFEENISTITPSEITDFYGTTDYRLDAISYSCYFSSYLSKCIRIDSILVLCNPLCILKRTDVQDHQTPRNDYFP